MKRWAHFTCLSRWVPSRDLYWATAWPDYFAKIDQDVRFKSALEVGSIASLQIRSQGRGVRPCCYQWGSGSMGHRLNGINIKAGAAKNHARLRACREKVGLGFLKKKTRENKSLEHIRVADSIRRALMNMTLENISIRIFFGTVELAPRRPTNRAAIRYA